MSDNELGEFEIVILKEVGNYKKNEAWIAPRNLELSFGDGFELKIQKALTVLANNKYIQGHGSPHQDGTHGVYKITPLGKQILQKMKDPVPTIGSISNSNVAINSSEIIQNLEIKDPKIKQAIIDLKKAIDAKNPSKIKKAFGCLVDKAVDVAIQILLRGIIS